jgi:hypothetical protein
VAEGEASLYGSLCIDFNGHGGQSSLFSPKILTNDGRDSCGCGCLKSHITALWLKLQRLRGIALDLKWKAEAITNEGFFFGQGGNTGV